MLDTIKYISNDLKTKMEGKVAGPYPPLNLVFLHLIDLHFQPWGVTIILTYSSVRLSRSMDLVSTSPLLRKYSRMIPGG